jgi:hypothetical protein
MDIQLDQMRSKNAKQVAHSKSNMKMGNFMESVNNTDGIYGDKSKNGNGDGKPKLSEKGGLTYVHDGSDKYLHGGNYSYEGKNFSGENTSTVNKGLKPYVTIDEATTNFPAGTKIYLKGVTGQ